VPWLLTDEHKQKHFFANKNMAVVSQPPYLPDLALCALFLFSRMKSQL
jgi:hypothetical protein